MSDDTPAPSVASDRPSIQLRAQYIKDLSFENPRAPASIFGLREPPQMEISLNLSAQRLDAPVFELAIHISCRAISEKTTVFLCDLVYAGVLEITAIPEPLLEQAILVQGAQILFPFARRVIADITRDGGFPPLQLEPMDFAAMYEQQRQKQSSGT